MFVPGYAAHEDRYAWWVNEDEMGHAAGKEEMLMLVGVKILAMEWMIRSAI